MKYPPTSEPGSPVSACQRSGSVKVDIGIGTTRTLADAGSRSEANTADQPGGSGVTSAAGRGFGTMGKTARTAQDITTAAGRQPAASRGSRRAAKPAKAGPAASAAKASTAAPAPAATMENRSGRAALNTGRPSSQYQGSLIAGCACPANSRVPPSENTASTAEATAAARTGSRRQQAIAASTSTMISGQPR